MVKGKSPLPTVHVNDTVSPALRISSPKSNGVTCGTTIESLIIIRDYEKCGGLFEEGLFYQQRYNGRLHLCSRIIFFTVVEEK